MRFLLRLIIGLPILALAALSFAGLLEFDAYWIRMSDFPRLQYLIALMVLTVLLGALHVLGRGFRIVFGALALAAIAYNVVKLEPYLPGEITAESCPAERQLDVMIANVQLGNRESGELVSTVREAEPDLFFAMETDGWWEEELSVLEDEMPHTAQEITGSYFGLHLFSRLPLSETETPFPMGQDAPAVTTLVELPSGEPVRFLGVHPRPPHPGQSSMGRDAQLLWAGLQAHDADAPALVAGDLNTVPWESTFLRMRALGGITDPRLERGFLPSFDAKSTWMRWPLDHLLPTTGLTTLSLERHAAFGSDHYPMEATFCLRESGKSPLTLSDEMVQDARETLEAAQANAPKLPSAD